MRTSELMLSSIPFGWSLFYKVSIWEYMGVIELLSHS